MGTAEFSAAAVRHWGRADALNNLFVEAEATEKITGVNLADLDSFYASLSPAELTAIANAAERAVKSLPALTEGVFFSSLRAFRMFDVLLQIPQIEEVGFHSKLVVPVLETISNLTEERKKQLAVFWRSMGRERMERRLALFHQIITMRIMLPPPMAAINAESSIIFAAKSMAVLHAANAEISDDDSPLKFSEFYNETLNEELDVREDFDKYAHFAKNGKVAKNSKSAFAFFSTPFLLNSANKAIVLKHQSDERKNVSAQQEYRNAILGGVNFFSPFLVFQIRRNHLIQDTLENIVRHDSDDLKKEIKIKFAGEDGIDAGGVQKEFFQLIVREIFNPDFGMFFLDKDSRSYYFNSNSNELREFELIGTILGLAIYNGIILDVNFPLVVYKKLIGKKKTSLADLANVSPELHRGMQTLINFPGDDVESVYARNFQVEVDNFGEKKYVDLKPGGGEIPLTNANRFEFVELYVDYFLNKSVEKQFAAFKRGFDLVVNGPAFDIFSPEELELLICGEPELDFGELEKAALYEAEDFGPSNQVVKWFWEIVHNLNEEEKKKLLRFVTGSDRSPIGGLKNLQIIIQKSGGDGDDRLPSSHTCFNTLLIPNYSSREIMQARFAIALDNSTGFGLR